MGSDCSERYWEPNEGKYQPFNTETEQLKKNAGGGFESSLIPLVIKSRPCSALMFAQVPMPSKLCLWVTVWILGSLVRLVSCASCRLAR